MVLRANEIVVEPGTAIIKKKPASYFENSVLEILKDCDNIKYLGFAINYSDEWKGANTKLVLECYKHGIYETCSVNNLRGGKRCKKCGFENQVQEQSMSQELFIERCIEKHGEKYDYATVNYVNAHIKVQLTCNTCSTEFKISPSKHLHHGQGCRKCCKFGGFDYTKPGYFYVQKLTNKTGEYYKFGITYDVQKRMSQQKCGSKFKHELIHSTYFENGIDAVLLETKIKNTLECSVLEKDDLPDGYTETISSYDFEVLMEIINSLVHK
jgi:predicted GIY-YIG superfamily endonuclease